MGVAAKTPSAGIPGRLLPADAFPCGRLLLATSLSARMRGLLFSPESRDVMVLLPCRDIHTFGMRYALDVAFLDRAGRVCRVERDVLPNKRLRESAATAVLERRAAPREPWFEEGDAVRLGRYRAHGLPELGDRGLGRAGAAAGERAAGDERGGIR